MLQAARRLYTWMGTRAHSKHAEPLLASLFFIEAIFFLPTDPMLILYCLERRDRALRYATIATIASVLGGITGYFIGYTLWACAGNAIIHNPIINYFISPGTFTYLCGQYQKYECWAILIAGFTPVPYKAATLTAGFCKLNLIPFIICSFIARGARFYLFAFAIRQWGKQMKQYIDRYFNLLVVLLMIIVAGIVWFIR